MDKLVDKYSIPLVSVACITYNQDAFIRQCLDGFICQKTSFPFEVIVHDDCSTDATAIILKEYVNKYPDLILPIYQTINQYSKGLNPFSEFVFPKCRGKFIAICEGDDFWTDPFKLQKQVDFLEANNDYGVVHHEADYLFQKNGQLIKNHHNANRIIISDGYVFDELLSNHNNLYTPTVMFRRSLLDYYYAIDEYIRNGFLMGDYVMWLEFSQHCKFHYINESMATYRVLENSASKSTSYEKTMRFINSYYDIKLFFLNKYPIKNTTIEAIEQMRLSGNLSYAIKYKRNKEARYFASQLKINNWRILLKRISVFFPIIFRYTQKKNKL